MLTRPAFFEGTIRSGREADFDGTFGRRWCIWRQTLHALRVEVMREVEADDDAHRFPMVLQIAYPNRRALDEVLASPVRALGREATRGLNEFFAGRIFQLSTRLRNQVQNDAGP
jgi:hypothetical protein